MEATRSFSSSTLTMKDSSSRPYHKSSWRIRQEGRQQREDSRFRRVSDVYNNLEIFARLKKSSSAESWSFIRKCLFMTPALAFQFCTVLTAVFSSINLRLLDKQTALTSLHFVVAAAISTALIVPASKLVQQPSAEQKHHVKALLAFSLYLLVGTVLVLVANEGTTSNAEIFAHNETETAPNLILHSTNITNNAFSNTSYQTTDTSELNTGTTVNLTVLILSSDTQTGPLPTPSIYVNSNSAVPLYTKIVAFIGYVITASSVSAGHYLLHGAAVAATPTDDHEMITVIGTAAAALGGCIASFLGAADLTPKILDHIFILLWVAVLLLIGSTTCSLVACYSDAIISFVRSSRNADDNILVAKDRRPTRTAQEIFDECASLLGYTRRPSLYTEEGPSAGNLPEENDEGVSNSITQSETYIDNPAVHGQPDGTQRYQYQLPTTSKVLPRERTCLEMLRTDRVFVLSLSLAFFLSSSTAAVEYSSSVYLTYAAYEEEGYSRGTRTASAGTFMTYLVFIAAGVFYQSISRRAGWKRLALGIGLVASVLTLALAATSKVAVYFAAACIHGLMRAVVAGLPFHVSSSSQTNTVKRAASEPATSAILSMTSLSLGVAAAVFSPLIDAAGCHGVSVYYSAVSALLGCVILVVLC